MPISQSMIPVIYREIEERELFLMNLKGQLLLALDDWREMGGWLSRYVETRLDDEALRVYSRFSRDESLASNGGDYDYYVEIRPYPESGILEMTYHDSSDFDEPYTAIYQTGMSLAEVQRFIDEVLG